MKKECILYKQLKNKQVLCTCCNHYCVIGEGNVGKCGIRKNVDGKLYLLVYGKSLGIHIDPIEKKPLYHFLPGTEIFSFGTAGCNFRCSFCQNWQMSQLKGNSRLDIEKIGEDLLPEEVIEYCMKNKIPSIAYTYNEPTAFFEYAFETMKLAKKNKIKNIFVSNGYESKEILKMTKGYLDAINIDLKSFSSEFYEKYCGAKLELVLKNIEYFTKKTSVWTEVTTLIIPGENDSEKELKSIAKFLANLREDIPWHISAFYPSYKMMDHKATEFETLKKAYDIGKKAGLKYVYIGNVANNGFENTYCYTCSELLIKRNGYNVEKIDFDGKCLKCKTKVSGAFKELRVKS
ncbi:AmmeMemoRadiSam system radical SAM enzyme [Candidatus Gracilibacteria bacterium]|nr:AmmeMemoRadiSam system radical SAM enzyme [Candidatus Gracilibacteria bacterium]